MKNILPVLLCLYIGCTQATIYQVEVSNNSNAPDIDVLVIESMVSPRPPSFSLQAFNTVTPTEVRYYIDKRAKGYLRSVMDAHPLWAASRLQQFILVNYDNIIDTQIIDNALAADPFINSYKIILAEDLVYPSVRQGVPALDQQKQNPAQRKSEIINAVGTNIQSAWEFVRRHGLYWYGGHWYSSKSP